MCVLIIQEEQKELAQAELETKKQKLISHVEAPSDKMGKTGLQCLLSVFTSEFCMAEHHSALTI